MVTPWCVKVTCLSQGSDTDILANKFGVDRDTIDVPRNQQGPNYYAWINGFSSEQYANDFVEKWNNTRIRSGTIKCKALPTKSHVILTRPPSVPRSIGIHPGQGDNQGQFGKNSRTQSVGYGRK
jgi:hypothetical protein